MSPDAEPIPAPPKALCIGIPTYDDYDGVTSQSIGPCYPEATSRGGPKLIILLGT